jgi:hypothetical protein
MDMTKFENADDPGFKAVVGELRRWVKEIIREGAGSLYGRSANEEAGGRMPEQHVSRITHGSSQFGPTTVSGGSLFQGNYIGRDGGIF